LRKVQFALILFYLIFCIFCATALTASAVEPIESFIVKDIQYQSFEDQVRLAIVWNNYIECISYELDQPYRIVIDPLEEAYCDYEEKVYFDEGLIKSINFVKTKNDLDTSDNLYAFDFLTIELKEPMKYDFIKEGTSILLNVGTPPKKSQKEIAQQKEKEILEEIAKLEPESEPQPEIQPDLPPDESTIEEKTEDGRLKTEDGRRKTEDRGQRTEGRFKGVGLLDEKDFEFEEEKEGSPLKDLAPPFLSGEGDEPPNLGADSKLTLQDCIKEALDNYLSVKIAREQIELARLKVDESFREMLPVMSLLWSGSHGKISDQNYRGRKYGLEFKQPLFHGGELYLTWEQAKINLEVAQENYNKVKEDLTHEVSKAFYSFARSLDNLETQKELFDSIKADLELARKEYNLSLSTQLEFLNAQSSYDQVFYSIASSENEVSLKKLALNKVMNVDISSEFSISYSLKPKEFDINIDECIELAMQNRAELKSRHLMVKSTKLGDEIAKSQMRPQLDAVGKYMRAKEVLSPQGLGQTLHEETFLGFTAKVPIKSHTFEFAHKKGKAAPTVTTFESDYEYDIDTYKFTPFEDLSRYTNMKNSYIAHQQALSELLDVKQRIHSEVREAFYSLQEAKIRLRGAENNLTLYEKELAVTEIKKDLNEATVSEVMDAKIKLYSEKKTYKSAVADMYQAITSLNKAVGIGGYFH